MEGKNSVSCALLEKRCTSKRNDAMWLSNLRKAKRQTGQEYVDRNGKQHGVRTLNSRGHCSGQCRYQYTEKNQLSDRVSYLRISGS